MRSLTITTIDQLKPGDTFYKERFGKEIIYTVSDLKCSMNGKYYVKKGDLRLTDIIDRNEEIIFLNHKK